METDISKVNRRIQQHFKPQETVTIGHLAAWVKCPNCNDTLPFDAEHGSGPAHCYCGQRIHVRVVRGGVLQ